MSIRKNIFKSLITTFLGISVVGVTILLIFTGTMDWIWEGIAGVVIGTILILSPDKLVEKVSEFIGKFSPKKQ